MDVSLWDTQLAFDKADEADSKKRKADDQQGKKGKKDKEVFMPGEIWRAKNVSLFLPLEA